ncbi:MAG: right-handed parallel beta-helix repeat-containing protein [Candidatus Hodarchaeales archaeon]
MKKGRLVITLMLIFVLAIFPVQSQSIKQEEDLLPDIQLPYLRGTAGVEKIDIREHKNQDLPLNSDNAKDNSQKSPITPPENPKWPSTSIKRISAYTPRGPITILNNTAFGLYGFLGSGSPDEPYQITGYNITDSSGTLIHIENTTEYFSINNCYLDGLGSTFDCIYFDNVTHATVENNIVCNTIVGGLFQPVAIRLLFSNNNTINDNIIHDSSWAGIYLSESHNNSVIGNTIYNIDPFFGIYVDQSSDNILSYNNITDCTNGGIILAYSANNNKLSFNTLSNFATDGIGIGLWLCEANTLANNNISYCSDSGIRFFESTYNNLSDNTISYSNNYGIYLEPASNYNNILNNNISNILVSKGIFINTSSYNTVNGNIVHDVAVGIHLSPFCFNNTLSRNEIYDIDSGTGIKLGSSSNNTLLENTIHDVLGGATGIHLESLSNLNTLAKNIIYNIEWSRGIEVWDSQNNVLSENLIYNITGTWVAGIYVYDSSNTTLSSNEIYDCDNIGIDLSTSNNNTIFSNTVYDCNYGIYVYDSSNNTVRSNIIYNNMYFGLYISSSVLPVSENNTVTWNNFVNNYPSGPSQAYDSEFDNIIMYNYWDNHTAPDTDLDGFVDVSFYIYNDTANNNDPYPRTYPWRYHTPIYIDDNTDFALLGFPGNGTKENPYMITNYYFVHSSDTLIHIEDTSVYFHITNNILNGLGGSNDGIYLKNVIYGTIENNIAYDLRDGIFLLVSSNNNNLMGNVIFNCGRGIDLSSSHTNIIWNNTIHDSTYDSNIMVYSSNSNEILSNTLFNAFRGITLESSSQYNILSGNTIFNITHIAGPGSGIHVDSSSNNNISDNTMYYCSSDGISLVASNNNSIFGNTIYNNSRNGISLDEESNNNSITYNNIYNNTNYGFRFDSSPSANNTVMWNNFVDNNVDGTSQASDWGIVNIIKYNYWNNHTSPDVAPPDGFVDDPFSIDGAANNNDTHPLTNPVSPMIFIVAPISQDYGTNTITVLLSGYIIHYWYYIEGIDSLNRSWTGSEDRILAIDGPYTLHAYGNDSLGNIGYVSVTFTIDTTPPDIDISSPISTTYSHTDSAFVYTISEKYIVTIYLNGITNTTAIPSGTTVSDFPDVPTIPDGIYNLTIVAVDMVGNIGKKTVIFTIDTTPPSVVIDSPISTTYSTGTISIELSVDSGIVHYWYFITGEDSVNQTWTDVVSRNLPDGIYTLHAYGNDSVGNIGHASVTFTIDTTATTTPPTTTIPTTTTSETSSSTTTTTAVPGSFPGIFTVLIFFTYLVVFIRRRKRI